MTIEKLNSYLNRTGTIRPDKEKDLIIKVKIIDVAQAYGRITCLVTPLEGWGEKWVNLDSIDFMNQMTIG